MNEIFKLWDFQEKKVLEVEAKKVGKEWKALCPKHNDKIDSLSINKEKEVYNCFGCPFEGHLYNPTQKLTDKPKKKPREQPISINYKIMEKRANEYQGDIPQGIREARGLSDEIIDKYKIGYCNTHPKYSGHKKSISIPIYHNGKLVNIRYHSLDPKRKKEAPKILPYQDSLPFATWLYPEEQLDNDVLIFTEGELDALCCISHGLPAITRTCGAITWKPEFTMHFKDKNVYVCQDCDNPGREGAEIIAEELLKVAKEVRVIDLRLDDGQDLTDYFVTHNKSKEELQELIEKTPTYKKKEKEKREKRKSLKAISLEELLDTFKKWLELEETEYIETILATVVSNQILGDPVWLFVIGPSGASKTEVLRSFSDIENVYTISTLTAQSLISGMRYRVMINGIPHSIDPSILPKLKEKTMIIKDFTTILSLRAEDKQIIFSDLREAYDGYIEKTFGNIGKQSYKIHFSVITGVTPVLDKYITIQQQLGERFLKLRLQEKESQKKIKKAVKNLESQVVMRKELSTAIQRFFSQGFNVKDVQLSEEIENKIVKLAQYVATLRTAVSRNPYRKDILEYIPEEEIGTRIGIQLAKLGKSLASIRGQSEITEAEYKILYRIARDTIPKKTKILIDCLTNQPYRLTTSEIKEKTGIENETCRYALKDLQVLGLVQGKEIKGRGKPIAWKVTEKFENLNIVL